MTLRATLIFAGIMLAITSYVGVTTRAHVPNCVEDENWIVVDWQDPRGVEDIRGVSRACVHYETETGN